MKNKRKTVVIGIGSFFIGAAASAAVAAAIWNDRENKRLDKEINRLMDLKREIESFGEPTPDKVDVMNLKTLNGIAYQLELNNQDGYGVFAIKCAAKVIRKIAECMKNGETLSNFASRTKYGDPVAPVTEKGQKIFGISCGKCPNCNSDIYSTTNQYCHSCGKAINWSKQ